MCGDHPVILYRLLYSLVWNKRPGRLLIFWQFGHRVGLIPSGRLLIFGDDSDFIEVTVTSLLSKGSFISYSRLFIFGELSHGVFYFIGSCIPYQRVSYSDFPFSGSNPDHRRFCVCSSLTHSLTHSYFLPAFLSALLQVCWVLSPFIMLSLQ